MMGSAPETASKPVIFYFSATHWDREWYQTFQGFRYRLVPIMDELIDVLEKDTRFGTFHLDGQTIVLNDYLEIEPERRNGLEELIRGGRLLIGPWYVMPDEFLLSGESLIRNLMIGHRIAGEWGTTAWKYGYACDIFGHIAQMPQIFNGFGIRHALVGRGTNEHTTPAHFRWQSPDGSECVTYKLPDYGGYGAYGWIFGNRNVEGAWSDEKRAERIIAFMDGELARTELPLAVLMDGSDHEPLRKETPEIVAMLRRRYPDADVRHEDLLEMGRLAERFKDRLPVKTGELYEPGKEKGPFVHVITHTLSSRYPLKQANDKCQALLEKWVEPLAAVFALRGYPVRKAYVDLAYRHLIENHPHDSICGCSIDLVHKDMEYRFNQTESIGNAIIADLMANDRSRFESEAGSDVRLLNLWNPLPFARREVLTVDIDFPIEYPARYQEPFGYEEKNSFKIIDREGNEIPYGLVSIRKNRSNSVGVREDRHTVSFEADMPACGRSSYRIVPSETPSRYLKKLSKNDRETENDLVRLTVNEDGTVSLYDKLKGRHYESLVRYLDDGEIGDGWYHANPAEDRTVSSAGAQCTIERVEEGPSRTVFRVSHVLRVPEALDRTGNNQRRSDKYVELKVVSRFGLSKGSGYVDVETVVSNTAKDHRLRLSLPTGVQSGNYFVNQPFAFVERKAGVRSETQDWKECDVPEKQMGGIVGRRNADGCGLAFVSSYGLHECAARDDDNGTLDITLFRSFARTVLTNGEEGGQLPGDLRFSYALMPLNESSHHADLIRLQDRLQTGFQAYSFPIAPDYPMPEPTAFFEIESRHCCLSIAKPPESGEKDAIIVRISNYSERVDVARMRFFRNLTETAETDFNENETAEPIAAEGREFRVELAPWKVQTYRIRFK